MLPPRVALGGLLLTAGCLRVPEQSGSLATVEGAAVTSVQLQLRIYEAGRRYSHAIEAAADSIARLSRDPLVRQRALRWKIAAVPLVQEASLQNDPVIAAVDLLAFAMQQEDYFDGGDGREAFGPLQPIARDAAATMEEDALATLGRSLERGELEADAVERLRAWTASHPIRGAELRRESILSSDSKLLGVRETSLMGTVASLDRTLVGITNRLGYINEGLLAQVRWHLDLMAADALATPRIDSLLSALSRVTVVMGDVLAQAPALMERQQALFFHELGADEAAAFAAIDAQRIATLEAITAERVAVLHALREERVATLTAMDSIARQSIAEVGSVALRLLMWTFVGLLALLALTALAALGLLRTWRARGVRRAPGS
ncbi:MAG TPA: hypothetical protein VLE53_20030 [Gemmatimonadaceae bacterium]|nr:hypothetical protein [Gemmatimonadaceae bacterium]